MKRVLVTGAGVRLGRAIAKAFVERGDQVYSFYNRSTPEFGEPVCVDLRDAVAVAEATAELGPIDVLVNNAAAWERVPFRDVGLDQYDQMQALNTRAPYFLMQDLAGSLECVINLLDVEVDRPVGGYSHYTVSKAGLEGMTRALAKELAPKTRVNAIAPGTVLMPEGMGPEVQQRLREATPLRRFGGAGPIAQAALYLADASWVTGQVLHVDGGRRLV